MVHRRWLKRLSWLLAACVVVYLLIPVDTTTFRRAQVLRSYGTAIQFVSENEVFFEAGNHFEIRNIRTEELVASLDVPVRKLAERVHAFHFCSDNKRVLIGNYQGEVLQYDIYTGRELWRIQAHDRHAYVIGLTYCQQTDMVFSSTYFPFKDGKLEEADNLIKKWDGTTGDARGAISGHLSAVGGVAALTRQELLSCSGDGTQRVWNSVTGDEIWREGTPHPTTRMDFGGKVGALIDGTAAIGYHRIVLSADKRLLLFGTGVWDLAARRFIGWLQPRHAQVNEAEISSSAFTPDGKWALLGDRKGKLQLWDIATQTQLAEAEVFKNGAAVTGVAVSPSGKFAITSGYGEIPGFEALANKVPFRDKRQVQLWKLPELK